MSFRVSDLVAQGIIQGNSAYATIFYDSANTGYYVDPASNSNIYQLTVNGDHQSGYGIVRVTSSNDALVSLYTGNNATAGLRLQNSSSLDLIFVGKKSGSTDFVVDFGFVGSSEEFIVDSSGNTFSRTSSRAPIFYDSDNTSYYLDPASTSNLNGLQVGGSSVVTNNGGTWNINVTGTAGSETLATVTGRGASTSTALTLNGTVTFTPAWAGGSGDLTNVTNPSYKVSPVSGYWRIVHTSSNSTISGVYNYETNKDVYWGEASDSGSYYFRGRTLRIENTLGTYVVLHSGNYNSYAPTLTGGGASGTWGISITGSANTLDGLDSTDFMRNYGMLNNTDVYVNFRVMRNNNSSSLNDGMYIGYGNTNGGITRIFGGGATSGELIKYSNYTYEPGSFRAPIFYDSDNTAYYLDPNAFSNLSFMQINSGTAMTAGWNRTLLLSATYPVLVFNSSGTKYSGIGVDHSVADSGFIFWVNGSSSDISGTGAVAMRINTGNYVTATGSFRAPIFYDSADTGYYLDPNSTSNLNILNTAGVIQGGSYFRNNGVTTNTVYYASTSEAFGNILAGVSGSSRAAFFRADRTDAGASVWWGRKDGSGNSVPCAAIDATDGEFTHWVNSGGTTGSWTKILTVNTSGLTVNAGSVRAPIFYDSQNTDFFCDPNSTSVLSSIRTFSVTNIYPVSTDHQFGMYFGTGDGTAYAIYRESGSWTNPYPDLRISFHTGIKLGANANYNGIRFYDDYTMVNQVMSVNNASDGLGANNVYVNNSLQAGSSLRAPIFYDSDNTTYYADFANSGTSMYTAGIIRTAGMNMKGSETIGGGGGQIYPTMSNGGVSLYGGNNFTNGAYFTVTGIDYGSSPGAGSAEFVIRSTATSKFALFSYNGSTWTGRYGLFGSTGNVTIGDANTDIGYRLYVIGDIYATGNVIAYSDARVKTNIREIENPLARVLNTRGVMYDRTDNEEKDNVGFIAQELEKEFPELISTSTDGRKGVKYQNMVAVLIEAMKEQNKEIQKLKMLINGTTKHGDNKYQ